MRGLVTRPYVHHGSVGVPAAGRARTIAARSQPGFPGLGRGPHVPGAAWSRERSLPWACDCAIKIPWSRAHSQPGCPANPGQLNRRTLRTRLVAQVPGCGRGARGRWRHAAERHGAGAGDPRGSGGLCLRRDARMARKVLGPGPQTRTPGATRQRGAVWLLTAAGRSTRRDPVGGSRPAGGSAGAGFSIVDPSPRVLKWAYARGGDALGVLWCARRQGGPRPGRAAAASVRRSCHPYHRCRPPARPARRRARASTSTLPAAGSGSRQGSPTWGCQSGPIVLPADIPLTPEQFRSATDAQLQHVADTTGAVVLGRAGMVVFRRPARRAVRAPGRPGGGADCPGRGARCRPGQRPARSAGSGQRPGGLRPGVFQRPSGRPPAVSRDSRQHCSVRGGLHRHYRPGGTGPFRAVAP